MTSTVSVTSAGDLVAEISRSRTFRDYHAAFTELSGLVLELSCPDEPMPRPRASGNSFCEFTSTFSKACEECLRLQHGLDRQSTKEPHTTQCYAGLYETSIPVHAGQRLVAYLHISHVRLHRPDQEGFNRVARTLLKWKIKADLSQVERLWRETLVVTPRTYQLHIRLLTVFADHLGILAERLDAASVRESGTPVERAMHYVREHLGKNLALAQVATAMNLSAHYFSRKFAEQAGMGFTEFVNRARIEKARSLLKNPGVRVSEAAFDSGFKSLSQFNRIFLRVTGKTPRQYQSGTACDVRHTLPEPVPAI
ncbi:MAG: helix-turn-helix domain-containing protein [Prosthecobacter sp.]|jgi:AraC-like DNA-binding protein